MSENYTDPLDDLGQKADSDPSFRPDFYKLFLSSELVALGHIDGAGERQNEQVTLEEGQNIELVHIENEQGAKAIPVFSSIEMLQTLVDDEVNYLQLPARPFLEMTLGQDIVLNPGTPHAKFLSAFEIDDLLKNGAPAKIDKYQAEGNTEIMIGKPAEPPTELMDTVGKIFARAGHVKAAWLILYFDQTRHKAPSFLIGLDCDETKWDALCTDAYTAATPYITKEQGLDFVRVDRENPDAFAKDIMKMDDPFFEKAGS